MIDCNTHDSFSKDRYMTNNKRDCVLLLFEAKVARMAFFLTIYYSSNAAFAAYIFIVHCRI